MNADYFEKYSLGGRLTSLLRFCVEIDALKEVTRRTSLYNFSRRENVAEHSWEVAILALLFAEFADRPVDVARVVKMLLIHDIVEIDAGDTFVYDVEGKKLQGVREGRAAERIFGLLPGDVASEFRGLWEEFEERITPDAKFAAAMDRWQPLLHNYLTQGGAWRSDGVTPEKVYQTKRIIAASSSKLWQVAKFLMSDGLVTGCFDQLGVPRSLLTVCDDRYLAVTTYMAGNVPVSWQGIVANYELKYGIEFSVVTFLPNKFLESLAAEEGCQEQGTIYVASERDAELIGYIDLLGTIANQEDKAADRRQEYMKTLVDIYRRLPATSEARSLQSQSIWIAPRREGHLIATCLRDEAVGLTLAPHAKRILIREGMLVGLTELHIPEAVEEIVLIDGAIASGATIMTILHSLPVSVRTVHVIAAHGTQVSVARLLRFASGMKIALHLNIGHVSGILNSKLYAVRPDESSKVVVGDLGDLTDGALAHKLYL